jgi:hypothetical protein
VHAAVDEAGRLLEVVADCHAAADELVGELEQLEAIQAIETELDHRRKVGRKLGRHERGTIPLSVRVAVGPSLR